MPPKKVNDSTDDAQWRQNIVDAPLNEDKCVIKVVLLEIAGSQQEIIYTNRFETYSKEGKRSVVKNICKSETMFMINQLGAEKKVKDENLRVFEEGHAFLKEKKNIPPDVLALIIKYLILKMKEEYILIKEQKLVIREGMRKESLTMLDRIEVKNNSPIQNVEPAQLIEPLQNKSKAQKGEGVIISPKPDDGKKYITSLRVRGEEWRDKVYVDDYPLDGPDLYLAITGFLEPCLIENLVKIGVPITAIVQIKIDPVSQKNSSGYLTGTKRRQSATDLAAEKAFTFWETVQQIRSNKDTAHIYKDIAFIVFNPPYRGDDLLSSNSEKIYDEVSFLLYDIQDLTRQHCHYIDNMEIEYIPAEDKNSNLFDWYHEHVHDVPLESTSIFFILDSMLRTIGVGDTDNFINSRSSLSSAATLLRKNESTGSQNNVKKTETLVNKVFDALSKNDYPQPKYEVTCGEANNFDGPIIINHGDYIRYSSFHLENLKLDDFILSSLGNMPFSKLWKNQKPLSNDLKSKADYHISALKSCFDRDDLDTSLLCRLIHLLSFRQIYNNRSSLENDIHPTTTISEFNKVYLKRSTLAEPLLKCSTLFCTNSAITPPDPFAATSSCCNKEFANTEEETIKLLYTCSDLSELVTATEIKIDKPLAHLIDEYDYFEDFTCNNGFQMLLEAFNKFNCINYKYCEVTDSFLMMFFNDYDIDGISRKEWRCHIPTPVTLQDFFEFVLEEQLQWIQKEEKSYEEITALKTKLELKESLNQVPARPCIENMEELDSEFLIPGSLKYQNKYCDNTIDEELDKNRSFVRTTALSVLSTEPDSKSSYKTKSSFNETKKKVKPGLPELNADIFSDVIQCPKHFWGYNLGDRRVEVFGRDCSYFSKDGTTLSTYYTITIPANLEYLYLNVTLGNNQNKFYLQKQLRKKVCTDPESFRIITKGHVMFYIKRNDYRMLKTSAAASASNKRSPKASQIKFKRSSAVQQEYCTKLYYSFSITWPNGLIIESVHESNQSNISHIKQYFIEAASSIHEDMRCFTLNGEVIVFKKSGVLEVFKPDGTYIKILGCFQNSVTSEPTDDVRSDISSDRARKGKSTKSRDKLRKSTSKSSKDTLDQKSTTEITTPYHLSIDEFEIISNYGVKEKWVKDQLICAEKVLIRTATDYCLGEVLSRRMDGTNILINRDGIQIITFYDKTRIITTCFEEDLEIYPELTEMDMDILRSDTFESGRLSLTPLSNQSIPDECNSFQNVKDSKTEQKMREDGFVSVQVMYTIEHASFATVVINKSNDTIKVESANNTSLTVDSSNNYNFYLDESSSANFDGQYLDIVYKGCDLCHSSTKCKIKINSLQSCSSIDQDWLTMKDSFGKTVVVDDEGTISIAEESDNRESDDISREVISENVSDACHSRKCREKYEANMYRFFVFHRNLTCSELVHRYLISQYETECRKEPWCSIRDYDTFGDHRSLVSILAPIRLTEKEKWLMRSKYSNKPKQLKYKDLNVDTGKGFYHWMHPYQRFQPKPKEVENIELPRLPRAYVLRTLEKLWNEETRTVLKGGKEMIVALLKYRRLLESESQTILNVPIKDPRTENQKRMDEKLKNIAKRMYDELKNHIADEVQADAKLTITTKRNGRPPTSVTESMAEGMFDLMKKLEETDAAYVKEVAEVDKPSATLENYWQRRAEQAKDEEFYKQLLREESIPPYFRNILGGALWLEMNQAADDAVKISEGEPSSCVAPGSHGEKRSQSVATP